MKIPSCFYGTRLETRKECNKVARKLWKGEPLLEAVAEYDLIDTKDVPWGYTSEQTEGCLMLEHPMGIEPGRKHFCMTWLPMILHEKFDLVTPDKENIDRIFYQMIENDWSIIGLGRNDAMLFHISPARRYDCRYRWQPYLRKLCEFWDKIYSEEKRYVSGANSKTFLEANLALRGILVDMGVPKEEVDRCAVQFPADLKALCDKYGLLTMDVYNDPRIPEEYRLKD